MQRFDKKHVKKKSSHGQRIGGCPKSFDNMYCEYEKGNDRWSGVTIAARRCATSSRRTFSWRSSVVCVSIGIGFTSQCMSTLDSTRWLDRFAAASAGAAMKASTCLCLCGQTAAHARPPPPHGTRRTSCHTASSRGPSRSLCGFWPAHSNSMPSVLVQSACCYSRSDLYCSRGFASAHLVCCFCQLGPTVPLQEKLHRKPTGHGISTAPLYQSARPLDMASCC